jgi:hypothetical protein
MNWEGFGRNLYANIGDFSGVYLVGPRKTTKNLSQDDRSPVINPNPRPSENKTEVLLTREGHSVILIDIFHALYKISDSNLIVKRTPNMPSIKIQ